MRLEAVQPGSVTLLEGGVRREMPLRRVTAGDKASVATSLPRTAQCTAPAGFAGPILRLNAGLVHINSSLNAKAYWRDLAYLLVARLCGARVLYQVHGGRLDEFAPRGLFAAFVSASLRLADAVVVLSRQQLAVFRERLAGHAVDVVANGIDCAPYMRYKLGEFETVESVPTRVVYPEQGVSHFRMLRDNLRISATHTRLFLGMFLPRPRKEHWSRITRGINLVLSGA